MTPGSTFATRHAARMAALARPKRPRRPPARRVGPSLVGQAFGRLVVLALDGRDRFRRRYWLCRCACGAETVASTCNLRTGNTRSCGCLRLAALAAGNAARKAAAA